MDQLDLSTNEPKTKEESTDVKPTKLEDGQTDKGDLTANDDLAGHQKADSPVIINLPASASGFCNPLYSTDRNDLSIKAN